MNSSRFTVRDRHLCKMLSAYGVLSTRQIGHSLFAGVDARTVLRRLRKLKMRGLIESTRGLDEGALAWTLTAKGSRVSGFSADLQEPARTILPHAVTLSEIRLKLEEIGLSRGWQAEHTLRRQTQSTESDALLPDGLMVTSRQGKFDVVAVELELHLKARHRYTSLFATYDRKEGITCLWYLVPSMAMGRFLEKQWAHARREKSDRFFAWSLLDEVLFNPSRPLLRQGNRILPLTTLGELLAKKNESLKVSTPMRMPNQVAHSSAHTVGNRTIESVQTNAEKPSKITTEADAVPKGT